VLEPVRETWMGSRVPSSIRPSWLTSNGFCLRMWRSRWTQDGEAAQVGDELGPALPVAVAEQRPHVAGSRRSPLEWTAKRRLARRLDRDAHLVVAPGEGQGLVGAAWMTMVCWPDGSSFWRC